ncbi:MAG: hypothetical protein KDC90_16750, partial [Ignavibacteriae bacterium]|nr:hypothetical protein [Ignavibacteriota bacterium]
MNKKIKLSVGSYSFALPEIQGNNIFHKALYVFSLVINKLLQFNVLIFLSFLFLGYEIGIESASEQYKLTPLLWMAIFALISNFLLLMKSLLRYKFEIKEFKFDIIFMILVTVFTLISLIPFLTNGFNWKIDDLGSFINSNGFLNILPPASFSFILALFFVYGFIHSYKYIAKYK